MRTKSLRAGAAVTFLLLASVAVASAGSSGADDRASVVLNLVGKAASDIVYVDLGAPEYSAGDQYVFTGNLLRGDTKVGEDGGVCTVTRVEEDGASTLYCSGTNALPEGQITTAALVSYGPDEEFKKEPYFASITGGTGKYRSARGEVKITELGSAELYRLAFRIVL